MNFVIIVFCYVLRLEMFSRVSAALRIFIFVARSVVCVPVCLSVRHSSEPCKGAEPLEMPFGGRLARAQRTTTWGRILAPPGEYDVAAAMRSVVTITAATCSESC